MGIGALYSNPLGRTTMLLLQKSGAFRLSSWYLKTGLSKRMVPRYINRHQIDMEPFEGQVYRSFADFFSRQREITSYVADDTCLISPCDGMLSFYHIADDTSIPMKGSHYRLSDLIPDETIANRFMGGICLVFRLQPSDYHHFCAFDDIEAEQARFIPGQLHSVQPLACEKIPVYRLNRRWWSLLDTANFGNAVQVEIGAMMVGGVHFAKEAGRLNRGEEMGHFELAGSTILLIFSSDVRNRLEFEPLFCRTYNGVTEQAVSMGECIATLRK